MAAVTLNPYINFNDKAEEALGFYKGIFGGELTISRFSDFASDKMPVADEYKNLVMHGMLIADGITLMVADAAPVGGVNAGDNISISLSGDDNERLTQYFEGLSEGATIKEPLEAAPWGDKFGMLTDKFGIGWMVNISGAKN
jgi:PhnB protein